VLVVARDELELCWLAEEAARAAVPHATFHEPDLDWALTAIALGASAAPLVRKYPLAFSGEEVKCDE
jgi:hypothetical protein